MNKLSTFVVIASLLMALPSDSFAKGGRGRPSRNESRPVVQNLRIRSALDSANPALTDLASANARLQFESKTVNAVLKRAHLRVHARFPFPAPSLGITDRATALAATVHFEASRSGVVIGDCTMKVQGLNDQEDDTPTQVRFRLHVKTHGKKEVKGACPSGIPALAADDSLKVYAIVNGVRVDALDNAPNAP